MYICGVDEAGRGPLAGPVCAACVILPENFPIEILADSKKLTHKKREAALDIILRHTLWGVGWASAREIDDVNILQATFIAMRRAFAHLHQPVNIALVDGNQNPHLPALCVHTVVKGDQKEPCIMAASIVAKCLRDRYMQKLDIHFPHYQFARHKGYATQHHRQALLKYGPCFHHRRTFLKNKV